MYYIVYWDRYCKDTRLEHEGERIGKQHMYHYSGPSVLCDQTKSYSQLFTKRYF